MTAIDLTVLRKTAPFFLLLQLLAQYCVIGIRTLKISKPNLKKTRMKKTLFLAIAAITVSMAVNAQTDTTKRDTTIKKDTLRTDSTQAHAAIKNVTSLSTAQVNVLNSLKTAASGMLRPKED